MKIYTDKLKEFRIISGIPVNEIAERLSVAPSTIWSWENGQRNPKVAKLKELVKILNISISQISDIKEDQDYINKELKKERVGLTAIIDKDSGDLLLEKQQKAILEITRISKELYNLSNVIKIIIDSLKMIFYIKDSKQKYVVANNAFLESANLPFDISVAGKTDYDFFSVRESDKNTKEDAEVISSKKIVNQRIDFIYNSGKTQLGSFSKYPVIDSDGNVSGVIAIISNITESYIGMLLKDLMNCSREVSVKIFKNFNSKIECVYISDSTEKIYGGKVGYLSANNEFWLYDCVHPEDRDSIRKISSLRNTEKTTTVKFRIIKKNGDIRWIEAVINRLFIDKKHMFLGFIERDITSEREVEKLKDLLDINLNLIDTGIAIACDDYDKIYYNKGFEKIFGYTVSDFYKNGDEGVADFYLNICVFSDDREQEKYYNKIQKWPKKREFRIVRKDGQIRWIEINHSVVIQNGKTHYIDVYRDITEEKK